MIITETPLRISFSGGGTDLATYYRQSDGYVVSAAIDMAVFVVVAPRFDDGIVVGYSRKERVDRVEDIQNELVREAMLMTGVGSAVEITLLADVPAEGTGLGSSSSFAAGLLNALYAYQGETISTQRLAEEACELEIERCGRLAGKQDQYIAAYGGLAGFRFHADESVDVDRFDITQSALDDFQSTLFLVYSGQTRSSSSILSEQDGRTDVNLDALDGIKSLAEDARDALNKGDYLKVGPILGRNWELKQSLATGISTVITDEMYRLALDSGATGAKVCGAGGGGFLLVQCPPEAQPAFREALKNWRIFPVRIHPHGSRVLFQYDR